jgi:hypothetical protein
MSDAPHASDTPAESTAQPQAGTSDNPQAGESISLEEARKLRSEAKSLRARLGLFEKAEDERKQAQMSADEKIAVREQAVKDQEQRITARLQASILRDEIASAVNAEKITLHAPIGDVLRLLDTGAVEWDGETPKNVRALLKELVKERPYLASRRTGSADGGAGDGRSTGHTMNDLIRRAAGRE